MRERQTCVGCQMQSPETDTEYTLISAQFGWRLTRKRGAGDSYAIEWRCPKCWAIYKARNTPSDVSGIRPTGARSDSTPPNSEERSARDLRLFSAKKR
ncbi:MAG: hypothetical protein U0169_07385 [Polyangiaceae bacterium]